MASPRKWGGICRCKDQVYHNAQSFCVKGLGNSLDLSRFHSKRTSTTISLWKTNTAGYKELRWCQCAICMVWDFQDRGVQNNLNSHHQDKIKENFPSSVWKSILSILVLHSAHLSMSTLVWISMILTWITFFLKNIANLLHQNVTNNWRFPSLVIE
jgi:hypothetical protein